MITKFKSIKNIAVFNDFKWDNSIKDNDGNPLEFKKTNIIYGRNYSGKTTLSRIIRSLEKLELPEKYVNPEFCVICDGNEIKQDSLGSHSKYIRVFNEDFIKANLRFIYNPNEDIESFAILGDGNNKIEKEITELKNELGSNGKDEETKLYAESLKNKAREKSDKDAYDAISKEIDNKKREKATGSNISIKYNFEKFGKQNYYIKNLEDDIKTVNLEDFNPISNETKSELEKLIELRALPIIPSCKEYNYSLSSLSQQVESLVTTSIIKSDKIEEYIKDTIFLNKWAKEGYLHHKKTEHQVCAFCNNQIGDSRWNDLERHFDEASLKLEEKIDLYINAIKKEITSVRDSLKSLKIDTNHFYPKYHNDIYTISKDYLEALDKYTESLNTLLRTLEIRKQDIFETLEYTTVTNNSSELVEIYKKYNDVCTSSNNYTDKLNNEQNEAKELLRLKDIYDYLITIKYKSLIESKNQKQIDYDTAKDQSQKTEDKIKELEDKIKAKEDEKKDEKKGAEKVNEYLNSYFGNQSLSMEAIINKGNEKKQVKFEIQRDGKRADYLSEGECSLIAFCYFMAKLHEIDTTGKEPIIWIDDPISSLDNNHIFFVYSLINAEIIDANKYEQLFISTHNLDFLKYLKRLPGANNDWQNNEKKKQYRYITINRKDKTSDLTIMPEYLRKHITEFNYLFHQIYDCSKLDAVDDKNYTVFYNFGNNARKFLELFLYYKYPDCPNDGLERFFGAADKVPSILVDRINNEYSHLCGLIERGNMPIEVPEMRTTAQFIMTTIKESDSEQYKSLLRSIGINEN